MDDVTYGIWCAAIGVVIGCAVTVVDELIRLSEVANGLP